MNSKSGTFRNDLEKERQLATFLDGQYKKHLRHYTFRRENSISEQHKGVDVVFIHNETQKAFCIDEKAQLDYINEDLPTFAFELSYEKDGVRKRGWLFDPNKKTLFYALVTAIFSDAPKRFTSCKITLVNRQLLLGHLGTIGLVEGTFSLPEKHGKHEIRQLNPRTEGYLYYSKNNKAEQPLNLILKLDYLIDLNVARRLV